MEQKVIAIDEAFLAKIFFCGRNDHMWYNVVSQFTAVGTRVIPFLQPLCDKSVKWTASTILFHAHSGHVTRSYDRVFALACCQAP